MKHKTLNIGELKEIKYTKVNNEVEELKIQQVQKRRYSPKIVSGVFTQ